MELIATPAFHFTPNLFEGIIWRRVCAALADFLIVIAMIGAILSFAVVSAILTFGGFLIPALLISIPFVDILYTTLTLGGNRQATWGQRMFGIKAVDTEGNSPGYLRAFLFIALYYAVIVPTSHLVELIALFNDRRRTLPDFFSGMVFIRESAVP